MPTNNVVRDVIVRTDTISMQYDEILFPTIIV